MKKESRLKEFINSPSKALWKLSIPMMLGMSVNAFYLIVDFYFISKYVTGSATFDGSPAQTALGLSFPILFNIMGIVFGIGSGTTTVIAQSIGENNKKDANKYAEHSIVLGIFLSIFFIVFGYLFSDNIFLLQSNNINPNSESYKLGLDYIYIMLAGMPFMILSILIRAILTGEGDAILPVKILGLGTLINIILDPYLIYKFGMKGAAFATVISQFITFAIFIYLVIFKNHAYITFNFKNFKFNQFYIKQILKIGIPAALSMIIMASGVSIYNRLLENEIAIGAYASAHRIEHFFIIPLISISTSIVTIVGMFYGAKKTILIKEIIFYGIKKTLVISVSFSFILFFFSKDLLELIPKLNEELIIIAVDYFKIFSFALPFIGVSMICSRAIQGLGKSYPLFIITFFRVIVFSCSIAIILSSYGYHALWYGILISCILSSIISSIWLIFEYKKIK